MEPLQPPCTSSRRPWLSAAVLSGFSCKHSAAHVIDCKRRLHETWTSSRTYLRLRLRILVIHSWTNLRHPQRSTTALCVRKEPGKAVETEKYSNFPPLKESVSTRLLLQRVCFLFSYVLKYFVSEVSKIMSWVWLNHSVKTWIKWKKITATSDLKIRIFIQDHPQISLIILLIKEKNYQKLYSTNTW